MPRRAGTIIHDLLGQLLLGGVATMMCVIRCTDGQIRAAVPFVTHNLSTVRQRSNAADVMRANAELIFDPFRFYLNKGGWICLLSEIWAGALQSIFCVFAVWWRGGTPRVAIEQKRVRMMRKEGRGYLFRIAKNTPSP